MLLLVKLLLVNLVWTVVQSQNKTDKLFFLKKPSESSDGKELLLVVTWTQTEEEISAGCEFFTDKELIREVGQLSNDILVRTLSDDEMANLVGDCHEFNLPRRRKRGVERRERQKVSSKDVKGDPNELFWRWRNNKESEKMENETESNETDTTTLGYDGMPVIFPGTKWCGAGARAEHYDDLGRYEDTDMCCRAHDLCNDTLAPGETRNNLTNNSAFTKLSCDCDEEFYDCLDRIDSIPANTVGNMYFNVLRRDCYKDEHPATKTCKKYRTFMKLSCEEYETDSERNKTYQWVPAKRYKKTPLFGLTL